MSEEKHSTPEPDAEFRPAAQRPWQFSLLALLGLTAVAALLFSAASCSLVLVTWALAVVGLSFVAALIGALAMRG